MNAPASSVPIAIDNSGAIVEKAGTSAVEWLPGSIAATPLPVPPGSSWSGLRISDSGSIVVSSTLTDGAVRPYRLDPGGAIWTELAPWTTESTIGVGGNNVHSTCVGTASNGTTTRPVTFS